MVVDLDLTEKIIQDFKDCVKSGKYEPFLRDNKTFLDDLIENLQKMEFPKNNRFYWIARDFSYCLNYLRKFDPRNPKEMIPGVHFLKVNVPGFTDDIKDAIIKKNWDDFYWKYRSDADYMISEASKQKVFHLNIHSKTGSFDSFQLRDETAAYLSGEVVDVPTPINVHSSIYRNSGAMSNQNPDCTEKPEQRSEPNKYGDTPLTFLSNKQGQSSLWNSGESKLGQAGENGLRRSGRVAIKTREQSEKPGEKTNLRLFSEREASQKSEREASRKPFNEKTKEKPEKPDKKTKPGLLSWFRKSPEKSVTREQSTVKPENETISDDSNKNLLEDFLKDMKHEPNQQPKADIRRMDSLSEAPLVYQNALKSATSDLNLNFDYPKHQATSPTINLRQASMSRDSPEFDNTSFEHELHNLKKRHSKQLEELRAERRRKQKEFEEELQKMKANSKRRYEILLQCILMKHRFEEQEDKWKEWIQGCKQHIIELCKRSAEFVDDVNRNHRGLKKLDKVDQEELASDTKRLMGSIMITLNVLHFDFEHLKMAEEQSPDALFVRVLQKCLSDVAHKLLDIYASAETLGTSYNNFIHLQRLLESLTPNMIYTTFELHRICSDFQYNPTIYNNVHFPDFPQTVRFEQFDD